MKHLPPAVLAIFVLLAVYYSVVIPAWEAVDELDHYHYAQFVLTRGALPQVSTHGEHLEIIAAHHPPLYYAVLAALIAPIDHSNPKETVETNLDFRWGDPNRGGYNRFFHRGASEEFPYAGPVRALHVGRLISVVGGAAVLFATWRIARTLVGPNAHAVAGLAMAMVGFIPGFLVSAATVHHDSWVAALGALAIWRALIYVRRPTAGNIAFTALLLGLGALTKASMLGFAVLLPLAVALTRARRTPSPAAAFITHMAVGALVYFAVVGWWLVRNQILYGDPIGWAVFANNPLFPGQPRSITLVNIFAELVDEWAPASAFWRSLVFGAGQMVFGQDLLLGLFFGAVAIALLGLTAASIRRPGEVKARAPEILICLAALGLMAGGIVRFSLSFYGPNGRYFFAALPICAIGVVLGWRELLPRLAVLPTVVGSVAGLLIFAVLTPLTLFLPQYALANRLEPSQAAGLEPNLAVTFGRQIELIRAEVSPLRAEPGTPLQARLTWRASVDIARSYRAFVHVIGVDGGMVGGSDRVPANGAASTGLWRMGDVVFDEFELPLGPGAGPGLYRVVSGFYQFPDLARLPAEGAQALSGDVALLGQVKLLPNIPWAGQPLARFGGEIELAQAEVAPRLPRVGENLEVRLLWHAGQRPTADYTVSVQLLAPDGSLLAQRDSPPLGGALPTTSWDPGDLVPDAFGVGVPSGVPARFTAQLVVYSTATGQRLSVGGGDSFQLASLTLEPQ